MKPIEDIKDEPAKCVHCSKCGKPCEIVHDLDLSACCCAKTEVREIKE